MEDTTNYLDFNLSKEEWIEILEWIEKYPKATSEQVLSIIKSVENRNGHKPLAPSGALGAPSYGGPRPTHPVGPCGGPPGGPTGPINININEVKMTVCIVEEEKIC